MPVVDAYFHGIPAVFVEKYKEWFVIWAKNFKNWGLRAYFPLHNGNGRVLIDVPELDDHGNPPFIVVTLQAKFENGHLVISPRGPHDADLIARHAATLRS